MRTQTKQSRAIYANRFKGDKKVLGYEPATPRQTKWLKLSNGEEIPVIVSVGQIINVKKAWKRYNEK